MKFELEPYNRDFSNEDLISDLQKIAHKLKKDTLTKNEYDKCGKFSSSTCARRFGGWLKALEAAGLQKSREYGISKEEWFRNLEEVWVSLGKQPYPSDLVKPFSKYSFEGYKNKFGSWRKALEAFVDYINEEGNISSYEGIKRLKTESSTKHKTKRDINWRLRFLVLKRDNFKCKACGRSPAIDAGIVLHVDHVKAWANGGETVLENLQTLCSKCNIGKSNVL